MNKISVEPKNGSGGTNKRNHYKTKQFYHITIINKACVVGALAHPVASSFISLVGSTQAAGRMGNSSQSDAPIVWN
jgi:hypothetical protein